MKVFIGDLGDRRVEKDMPLAQGESTERQRKNWVDVAKFVAIIGVLTDHTYGILYRNECIKYSSWYSVSLFVLMMGVVAYWSMDKEFSGKKTLKKCAKMLGAYLIATFVYCLFGSDAFNFAVLGKRIIHFDASGPLYFVALYIQLAIVGPVLYKIIQSICKCKLKNELVLLGIIAIVSSITTNYTNILSIYGGGGKLLGGTYLFLYTLGIIGGEHVCNIILKKRTVVLISCVGVVMVILWNRFICIDQFQLDSKLPFGAGINPPGLSLSLYAILLALTIWALEGVVGESRLFNTLALLGRHTLYVFLYHVFFLDYILVKLDLQINIWLKRVVYFSVMICGSIAIEFMCAMLYRYICKICLSSRHVFCGQNIRKGK